MQTSGTPMTEGLSEQKIVSIAMMAAERSGDSSPTGISFSRTTGSQAERLLRPATSFDRPPDLTADVQWPHVVVIKITGTFTGYLAKVPPEADVPTGHIMYVMYSDAADPQFMGWTIGEADQLTPIERIGSVQVAKE